ncbi:MAG: DUF3806 domain-containing protein, partial [Planctomycetota bacterium]
HTRLTEQDQERLEEKRDWMKDHFAEQREESYASLQGKLGLLHEILRSGWVEPHETWKLQALGVTLGDALVQHLGMEWRVIEDEHGRSPMIVFEGSGMKVFPQTMISKRVEAGEDLDVLDLFQGLCKELPRIRDEAD